MLKKKMSEKIKGAYGFKRVTSWFYNGMVVATSESYRDYVKAREQDPIRTKMTTVTDVEFNKPNLKTLFPALESEIQQITSIYKLEKKEGSIEYWILQRLKKVLPEA